jgi:uncharacterized alpha-E superfamily protein
MLARVAESLYWMARYLERAENTARLINGSTQLLLDLPRGAHFSWEVLLKVAGLDELYAQHHDTADEDCIIRFLVEDARNPSSILSCIRYARENTRTFREVLPMEIWERINGLYLHATSHAAESAHGRGPRYTYLNSLIEKRQSVLGLLAGSMSHDAAYQFLRLGRSVERADMTTRILDINAAVHLPRAAAAVAVPERLWVGTLNALSAYQMYRRHVGVHVNGEAVVGFLLTDTRFPRAVLHCLGEIEGALASLPQAAAPLKLLRKAWRRVQRLPLAQLPGLALHDYLDQVQHDLAALGDAIARQYFQLDYSLQPAAQQ